MRSGPVGDRGDSDLRQRLAAIPGSAEIVEQALQAMAAECGVRLQAYRDESGVFIDDGAELSASSPGAADVRADIRIGGRVIDGPGGVLAYNYFPPLVIW